MEHIMEMQQAKVILKMVMMLLMASLNHKQTFIPFWSFLSSLLPSWYLENNIRRQWGIAFQILPWGSFANFHHQVKNYLISL